MDKIAEHLRESRERYRAFFKAEVSPILEAKGLNEDALGFAELSLLVANKAKRRTYAALAIEMLEANIEYYRPYAEAREVPNDPDTTLPVVSALVAAAAGQALSGPVAALLTAALVYYLARRASDSNHREQIRSAAEHNAEANSWRKTVEGWQTAIGELRHAET
jgi:hypothetical protein